MALTLRASGVYCGAHLNSADDLIPAEFLYDACRVMSRHVQCHGAYQWNFEKVLSAEIDRCFVALLELYLKSVLDNKARYRGWKLPETVLLFPWLVRLLPQMKFIYWVRDPRDAVLDRHRTDDLRRFNIPITQARDPVEMRAASWKYQYDIVKATPKPPNFLLVKFEDFVLDQDRQLTKLEDFLGLQLVRIPVDRGRVGMWRNHKNRREFSFLQPALHDLGYE